MEADPDGYIVLARRLAERGVLARQEDDPFLHHSHVWVENERGEVIPKFAPGYPALMALGYLAFGDEGLFIVSPVLGGIALLGSFLLFRAWMPLLPSLLALVTLATNQAMLFYSGYLLTHASSVCFITWGMYFLWKWWQRPGMGWALGTGLCLGFASTVRHSGGALALAVAAAVGLQWRRTGGDRGPMRRAALLLVLAYTVFPALLAAYNAFVFGHPLRTGYALSNEQYAFSFAYLARNFGMLNRGLSGVALPMIFPFAILGLVFCGPWPDRLLRWAWFLPIYALYASYYWATPNMAYLRFFIDLFPLLAGSAYLLLDRVNVSVLARGAAMVILCTLAVSAAAEDLAKALRGHAFGRREMAAAARLASNALPPDAVLFTRIPFCWHVGTRRNFLLYDLDSFTSEYGEKNFNKTPSPGEPRRQEARTQRFRDFYRQHTEEELQAMKRDKVRWFLEQGRPVAFLIPPDGLAAQQESLGEEFEFTSLSSLDMGYWEQWTLYQVGRQAHSESE